MNAPTSVLIVPSRGRVRRHGRSPLALLATVGLALVTQYYGGGARARGTSSSPTARD